MPPMVIGGTLGRKGGMSVRLKASTMGLPVARLRGVAATCPRLIKRRSRLGARPDQTTFRS